MRSSFYADRTRESSKKMPNKGKKQRAKSRPRAAPRKVDHPLRIVGGRFRGSLLAHHGEDMTRPMKLRTREAVFDLLGPAIKGKHAIDLFAGTGALGLEAISRGAKRATMIERHVPTAKLTKQNAQSLGVSDCTQVIVSDTFFWVEQEKKLTDLPWAVFCSPPYDYFVDHPDELMQMLASLMQAAPSHSIFVVESDRRFSVDQLPRAEEWDVRTYSPAVVAILQMTDDEICKGK